LCCVFYFDSFDAFNADVAISKFCIVFAVYALFYIGTSCYQAQAYLVIVFVNPATQPTIQHFCQCTAEFVHIVIAK